MNNNVTVSDDSDANGDNDAIVESCTNGDNGSNESPFAPMIRQCFYWRH